MRTSVASTEVETGGLDAVGSFSILAAERQGERRRVRRCYALALTERSPRRSFKEKTMPSLSPSRRVHDAIIALRKAGFHVRRQGNDHAVRKWNVDEVLNTTGILWAAEALRARGAEHLYLLLQVA